ncbi:MAG: DUF4142 domain-containing protein [Gemmatales bacterium]
MSRSVVILAVTLGLCITSLRADDDTKVLSNEKFVKKASGAGLAEVQLGKLASERGYLAEVKDFGKKMVEDHGKANMELGRIAESKNLAVETQLDADHKKLAQKLSQLSGREFDKAYVACQVKGHEEAVALFEKFSKEGSDPELKSFATKTLPTIKHHLTMIQELDNKLKGTR